jgi:bacterioferritin-associated ferredoxin
MYVCVCHAVTEQRVREEIASGASTPRQVANGCKAGTDCGSCVRRIQSILGHEGARPCPTARLASLLGLPVPVPVPADETVETGAEAA